MSRADLIAAAIAIALGANVNTNAEAESLANEMMAAKSVALADMKK